MTAPLKSDGKPMQALRVLAGIAPERAEANPLTEYDVYRATEPTDQTAWQVRSWHAALATLVAARYAKRTGVWGGYQWHATDAGRAYLASVDG